VILKTLGVTAYRHDFADNMASQLTSRVVLPVFLELPAGLHMEFALAHLACVVKQDLLVTLWYPALDNHIIRIQLHWGQS